MCPIQEKEIHTTLSFSPHATSSYADTFFVMLTAARCSGEACNQQRDE